MAGRIAQQHSRRVIWTTEMTIHRPSVVGLRTVAALEAAKGLLVMATGFGLLSLLHHDVQGAAESVVRHLHLNPARYYPRVFLEAAAHVTDRRLWLLAAGAVAYAAVRGVEAYGLWRVRAWAQWFAILSGGLYLPVEIFALVSHATALRAIIFLINVGVVGYVCYVRLIGLPEHGNPGSRRDRLRRRPGDAGP
jgi:uncharacterized membrane protein (DUF2068 family)